MGFQIESLNKYFNWKLVKRFLLRKYCVNLRVFPWNFVTNLFERSSVAWAHQKIHLTNRTCFKTPPKWILKETRNPVRCSISSSEWRNNSVCNTFYQKTTLFRSWNNFPESFIEIHYSRYFESQILVILEIAYQYPITSKGFENFHVIKLSSKMYFF